MKAVIRTNITATAATDIINNATQSLMAMVNDRPECYCGDRACTCAARYFSAGIDHVLGRVWYSPDHYGAEIRMTIRPDYIAFAETTCGGHHHGIVFYFHGKRCAVEVEHFGARRSCNSMLSYMMYNAGWGKLVPTLEFKIMEYQTSEEDWAFYTAMTYDRDHNGPALRLNRATGRLEGKPTCAEDVDALHDQGVLEEYLRKCEAVLRVPPRGLCYSTGCGGWLVADKNGYLRDHVLEPWTAVEYRRAAAMGVKL